jgi:hypothetical protein
VALLGLTPITDGDVWWHLKFGEVFWQARGFPAHDPFVFTAGTDPWIIRAWLPELLFYGVHRLAGPPGLILLKAALFTGAVALLWRLGAALGCPPPAAALALLLAALTARPRLVERPEVVSFLCLAAALALLARGPRGRSAYLLVPLQVLWANVHTSFYLGLLMPWPFIADAVAPRLVRGAAAAPADGTPSLRHLLAAAVLLPAASALTPQGWRVFLYPFQQAGMPTLKEVEEVQGLVANLRGMTGSPQEAMALILLVLAAAAVCGLRGSRKHWVAPGTWCLVAGSAAVPFVVYRFLPYAGMVLATVVMQGLGALAVHLAHASSSGARSVSALRFPSADGLSALLLALAALQTFRGGPVSFGLGVAPNLFPEGAARFIRTAGARGPMFNSLEFGGYLLWALYPLHRVFIHPDMWNSVSDDRIIRRFIRSAQDPPTLAALGREYGLELLVLPNPPRAWAFVAADPGWALLFWDQVASVYARRGGANAALIAARELRLTRYAADLSYLRPLAQDPARFAAAAAELRRLGAEDPQNWAARLSLAFLLKARGQDLPEALAAVEAAQQGGLRDPTLHAWKAEILAGLGRAAEAEAAAQQALRLNPAARAARLVLADLRARAGDREGAAQLLRALLALPDLSPEDRQAAEARLGALGR